MVLSAEDKELKSITAEFDKAILAFHRKEYKKAFDFFTQIIENHKDSEYESVLEIQAQSGSYRNLADFKLNPPKKSVNTDEEYINEVICQLNAGNLDRASKLADDLLEKRKSKDPYVLYLLALVCIKKDDLAGALKNLKKCFSKDDSFKIIAFNEPDFEVLSDNEEFLSLVE